MLKDFTTEYRQKLCTPEEAVEVVKSGDWVDYTSSLGKPVLLDRALAKRRDELFDVKIRGNLMERTRLKWQNVMKVRSILSIIHGIVLLMRESFVTEDYVTIFRWYFTIMQPIISIF